jgi:hypothetical protein
MNKIIGLVGMVLGFVGVAALLGIMLCFPLMWTWNYVMPYLFGLKVISWGQAWCLSFVCNTLIRNPLTQSKG